MPEHALWTHTEPNFGRIFQSGGEVGREGRGRRVKGEGTGGKGWKRRREGEGREGSGEEKRKGKGDGGTEGDRDLKSY